MVVFALALLYLAGFSPSEAGAAPVVDPSGPAVRIAVPAVSSASSATTRFTVSWSATSQVPDSGFDAYRVEYREPGVGYWLLWKQATVARSASFAAEAGHAYEFRAAATRTADPSCVGPWSAVGKVAVPADDADFSVTKKWTRARAASAYLGKVRTSSVKGAAATCVFQGTSAVLIAPRGRAYGKVAAYVRSRSGDRWSAFKLVKTVDLYSATARARVATTLAGFSSATVEREVKLVVTGAKNRKSKGVTVAVDGLAAPGAPHVTGDYWVRILPLSPAVVITEQLQLTATIPGCLDQRVAWTAYRVDRHGGWHTDAAGSVTDAGLYTAPALPSNEAAGAGDAYRRYVVTAVGAANPDRLYGSVAVDVTPGPRPVIASISPSSGVEGGTVTIAGSHFADHGGVPEVLFQGVSAAVSSYTDTAITAVVPGGWQTWSTSLPTNVWVRTWGQDSDSVRFTVTGIKPMPPSPWAINASGTEDDNASPGDTIRVYGHGFAPAAADNRVRFNGGAAVVANRYEADPYGQDLGTLYVTVPAGATSGQVTFQRVDGDGRWSTVDLHLDVRPATVIAAGLHPSFGGSVTGPRLVGSGTWGNEEWLLQGSSFSKLRIADYSTSTAGVFWLDMRRNGVTASRIMRAVSDTLAVPHGWWGEQIMMPDELFADAQQGDIVELRVRGDELTNRYERASAWFPVSIGERPFYGSISSLPAAEVGSYWGPSETIAKGSWLRINRGSTQSTQLLTAPGLWSGTLPLGADGIATKLVPLTTRGTYTITNQTSGESTQLVVADVGDYGTWTYGTDTQQDLLTTGLRMRFAGGEVTVPPGAFSPDDLVPQRPYFSISVSHDPSSALPWDGVLTDGGSSFSLSVYPYVKRLLKPITVTVPYEPSGRTTVPFLGLWDRSSGLYYDYGLSGDQIDTVDHKLTYVIPAGEYADPAAAPAAAPADAPAAGATASSLVGLAFNLVFRDVGAVSSEVRTSGQDYVWISTSPEGAAAGWGIRVDAVTDPTSSDYVSPAKAQEVLDVAAATWENLVGKGWKEPEGMIVLQVRDYGDPGAYQGATTKGVFGQPWVYVNSRLTMGPRLDTAVSHEMGHVFQRQLTANLSTKWIDEAVAEWVAWDTLGSGSDLKTTFEAGCDFPTVAFPSGFWAGYTTEQAYGAGAFIVWLADTYGPAAVLNIYDTLALRPQYWYDAPATFLEATRRSVPQLVAEFAADFWLQAYDPVRPYTWSSRVVSLLADYTGKTTALSMPADSSRGVVFAPTSEFTASLTGKPMVARAPGLPAGALVDVYSDSTSASVPPASPVKIGTLSSIKPVLDLGVYGGGCYRVVAVTPAAAALSASVTVEAVRLTSVSPASVSKAGGAVVTLSGCGFGDQKGTVMVGPAIASGATITSWTDTRIVFTMPNMGTVTGAQTVTVSPLVGGQSNGLSLTVF
jgi:hypothetical protein